MTSLNLISSRTGEIIPDNSYSEEKKELVLDKKEDVNQPEHEQRTDHLMHAFLLKCDGDFTNADLIRARRVIMGVKVSDGLYILPNTKQLHTAFGKIGLPIAVPNKYSPGGFYGFDKKDMKILFERLFNPSIRQLGPEAKAKAVTAAAMLTILMKIEALRDTEGNNEKYYKIKLTELQNKTLIENKILIDGETKNPNEFIFESKDLNYLYELISEKLNSNELVNYNIEGVSGEQIQSTINDIGNETKDPYSTCCIVCGTLGGCCCLTIVACLPNCL